MSRVSKLLGLVWLACAGVAVADDAIAGPECSADVCVLNVVATNLITEPCVGFSVLVAYSTSSGATLIQCSKPLEAEENRAFIYDRQNRGLKPVEISGGKFIRPDSWAAAETEGIPDKFASVPLCAAKNREAPAAGTLVVVEKRPNHSDDNPYCYRVNYVLAGKTSLTVRSDEGHELSPLSEKAAQEWAKLKANLSRYIDDGHAAAVKQARMASVVSDKAALFRSPDSAATSQMYLVKGDRVEIVDESKAASGWVLIRYVTKTGKNIERWVRAHDLSAPEK